MSPGGRQVIPRPERVVEGRPAPWARLADPARRVDLDRLGHLLAARGPGRMRLRAGRLAPLPDRTPAAVLVPLYAERGEVVVVLTKRAAGMRTNPGEISFPGGRSEPGEAPVDTARREAFEETALDPASVTVLGELDHLTTRSTRAPIVPVVGRLPGRPVLVPSAAEVDVVLHVPLSELTAPGVHREERWFGPDGSDRPVWFFDLDGETVWGATAAMLRQLLVVALELPDPDPDPGPGPGPGPPAS